MHRDYLPSQLSWNRRLEAHRKSLANAEYHRFWDELRNGFVPNPVDFTRRLKSFVAATNDQINPGELAQVCDLLLELEPSAENRRTVTDKFAARFLHVSPESRLTSLDKFPAMLAAKIHEAMPYEPKTGGPSLDEVMQNIAGSDSSWDPKSFDEIAKFSDAELRDFFLKTNGHHTIFYGRRFLDRIPTQNPEVADSLRERISGIFFEIAKTSPLYRFQVEFFLKLKVPAP